MKFFKNLNKYIDKFDYEKTKLKAKKIKKDFWTNDTLHYIDKNLQDFFNNHEKKWVENAKILRKDFPNETNLFLANMYRSNFSFKLMNDRLKLLKKSQDIQLEIKLV